MPRLLLIITIFIASQGRTMANCTVPTLLAASQTTDSTATLTWTDVGDAYQIELRQASEAFTGVPTHLVPNDPPFVVMGLVPGEQYKFRVRTVCTGGGESNWSAQRLFATQLNNERPCPLDFTLRDTTCAAGSSQFFTIHTHNAPGTALGNDVLLRGLRLVISHPWRSDLRAWLHSPDGTRVQVVGGLNAGDQNLGNPTGNGGCGQYLELTLDTLAPLLSAAAERDNITGQWRALNSWAVLHNGQNPNGQWLLEICDSKANHTGKLRLAQLVFESIACPAPDAPTVSNIQINSAAIGWNNVQIQGDSIEVVYGPKGFLPETSGQRLRVSANAAQPLAIMGLAGLQAYEVTIRQRCTPAGNWSTYASPTAFFTVCPAVLVENFDTLAICPTACTDPCPLPNLWQNATGDDYEWKVRTGAGLTFPVAGPPAGSGGTGNYLYFRNACTPSGANAKKAILRTLCLDVVAPAGPSACHFSLDVYMNTKLGLMGSLALEGSVDGGVTWQPIQTWSGNRGKEWRREFVNLAAYNGQTALFQLVATGVFGAYGDIAVDNLAFYSATPAGTPSFTFYRDNDGDGYGNTANRFVACAPNAPQGYVALGGDCNDNDPNTNPAAPETKCNGTDENCNGPADDRTIGTPVAVATTPFVCQGESAVFQANGSAVGQFFWFNADHSSTPIGIGNTLTINNVQNNTTVWLLDSIAAGGCASARASASVGVRVKPDLVLGQQPTVCLGESVDLSQLPLNDLAQAAGAVLFHSAFPATPANQLTNVNITPIASGILFAQKTTNDGCSDTVQLRLTVRPLPTVAIANGDSIALCKGRTVLLSANATGNAPLQYAWSNGFAQSATTVLANAVGTTNYTVTVSNTFGCTATDAIKVTALPGVSQANVTSIQNATSCGGNNGSITLLPLDGTAPFAFQWSGPNGTTGALTGLGAGGGTLIGLVQGGYRITITDATGLGCSMVLPSLVVNAPGLTVSSPTIVQPLCAGSTGSIAVVAVGTAPTYLWNTGATSSSIAGLVAGTYSVTITDGACQRIVQDLAIVAPAPLQIIENQIVGEDCFGQNKGLIDIAAVGGTGTYAYTWNDGPTTQDRANLLAGSYTVTITDGNGCTAVSPALVVAQPAPLVAVPQVQAALCNGKKTGSIALQITGGTSGYFVEWSNGAFSQNIQQLAAGNYTVTILDANQCSLVQAYSVSQPAPLGLSLANMQHPSCAGLANGSIGMNATGGTPGYTYKWNTGSTTPNLQNLTNGHYCLTVTDANQCTAASDSLVLVAAQKIAISGVFLKNIGCFGANSGQINLTATSANGGALTYTINGVGGTFPQNNLVAGNYLVRATDAMGCVAEMPIVLAQPAGPLQVSLQQVTNVSCSGEPSGRADAMVTGGTAPYTYAWSNGSTNQDLDGVPAGNYALDVTDSNGCQGGIVEVVIGEPVPLAVTPTVVPIACIGAPFGKIFLNVVGGNTPYSFQWSNGATTQNLVDIPAGNYTVSIFDASGCLTVYDRLEVLDRRQEFAVEIFDYQPVSCSGGNDGRLVAQVLNGTAPYQYAWSAPVGLHPNIPTNTDAATGLSGGLYSLTVTDAAGCFKSIGLFLVEEAPVVQAQVPVPVPIACKGAATGMLAVEGVGGVPPFTFIWSNGSTEQYPDSLPAGNYTVTITDFRGCTDVSSVVTLVEPVTGLTIATDGVEEDFCSNGMGSIATTAQGGYVPYTYQWNMGAQQSDIVGLSAGTYTLTLTDAAGCQTTTTWQLTLQPPAMQLASYSITNVDCKGAATGAIETGIFGGNLPLSYYWSNGDQTANITDLAAGQYHVSVLDNKGCIGIFELPLVLEPATTVTVGYSASGQSNGLFTVTLFPNGGTPGYTAQWEADAGNQTGVVATDLAQGFYNATVTDALGCSHVVQVYAGVSGAINTQDIGFQPIVQPNPSFGDAMLRWQAPLPSDAQWQIFGSDGRRVRSGTLPAGASAMMLERGVLGSGVYLLVVRLEDGRVGAVRWSIVSP
jgi:hypothetical protein